MHDKPPKTYKVQGKVTFITVLGPIIVNYNSMAMVNTEHLATQDD